MRIQVPCSDAGRKLCATAKHRRCLWSCVSNQLLIRLSVVVFALAITPSVIAEILMYRLFNHGDGNQNPPPYGLRLDGLFGSGVWTFSFGNSADFVPSDPLAPASNGELMRLTYDTVADEIHIFGTVYGGRDAGSDWDTGTTGLFDVDFRYTMNISATGSTPEELELVVDPDDHTNNTGTITPPSGYSPSDSAIPLVDFDGGTSMPQGFSFAFQPVDGTHRVPFPPPTSAWPFTDLVLFEGWGWLNHTDPDTHVVSSDWLFTGTHITPELDSFYVASMLVGLSLVYGAVHKVGRRPVDAEPV